METYLLDDYGVIEDNWHLKSEKDIKEYFEDEGIEYFDCGQGYFDDEVDLICKIGAKFYKVTLSAEIGSQKQDRGDRLYWVEDISDVSYKEIAKPAPKNKTKVRYNLSLTNAQRESLEDFMSENNIVFQ